LAKGEYSPFLHSTEFKKAVEGYIERGEMLRSISLTVVYLTLISTMAYAGGEDAKKGGGAGGFIFGANRVDFGGLNDKLKAKGFEELEARSLILGGGGYGISGRVVLGGEGAGFAQDVSSDTLKASVGGGYGFFDVGYVVYSKGGLRVFPLLGIGGGGISLKIAEKGDVPTFDQVLDDPGREVRLSAGGFLFQLALGVDYFIPVGGDENGKGGLFFGLRAGYVFSPAKADWKMEDRDVLGGPDVRLTGPYVCLMFGGVGGR